MVERFFGKDSSTFQQDLADLSANVIKYYSGATATEQEFARKKLGLGADWASTPKNLRNGLTKLSKMMEEAERTRESGYLPEAVQRVRENKGIVADSFTSLKFSPGGSTAKYSEKTLNALKNLKIGQTFTDSKGVERRKIKEGDPSDDSIYEIVRE